MVKVNYIGVTNPRAEFAALRGAHDRLLALMIKCKPQGPDYRVLLEAKTALDRAAQHFTQDPYVYGGSHTGQS